MDVVDHKTEFDVGVSVVIMAFRYRELSTTVAMTSDSVCSRLAVFEDHERMIELDCVFGAMDRVHAG
jgi:hypothetical protein